jgi:hypothetical protein
MYKIVILFVALCESETVEKHGLSVFENRVLRKIYATDRE